MLGSLSQTVFRAGSNGLNHPELMWIYHVGFFFLLPARDLLIIHTVIDHTVRMMRYKIQEYSITTVSTELPFMLVVVCIIQGATYITPQAKIANVTIIVKE